MSEIKPCPFCGGEAKLIGLAEAPEAYVDCTKCCPMSNSDEGAIKKWNTRHGEIALLDKVLYAIETRQECVEFEGGGRALAILRKDVEAMNGGEV